MTALALNFLALLIVLGLCWGAMMWLSGRFHGQRTSDEFDTRYWDEPQPGSPARRANPNPVDGSPADGSPADDPKPADARPSRMTSETPCTVCEGVGAHNSQGRLAPCPECYGTGVLST